MANMKNKVEFIKKHAGAMGRGAFFAGALTAAASSISPEHDVVLRTIASPLLGLGFAGMFFSTRHQASNFFETVKACMSSWESFSNAHSKLNEDRKAAMGSGLALLGGGLGLGSIANILATGAGSPATAQWCVGVGVALASTGLAWDLPVAMMMLGGEKISGKIAKMRKVAPTQTPVGSIKP